MRSIRFIAIAGLAAAVGVSAGQASQLVKPIPRPVIEAYANWEELRVARGWPTREAAAKLSSAKRIEIATAALTAPHREVRNVEYGFDLLLSGPPSRDATRLLAKAILMNDYNFGRKAPAVLGRLATESMQGCKSCVAAYAEIQYSGNGIPQNDELAFKWYRWAAIVGNAKGMEATAIALAEGRGTAKNLAEAKTWADRLEPPRRAKVYVELAKRIVKSGDPVEVAMSADLLLQAIALNPADAARPLKQLFGPDYPQNLRDKAMANIRAPNADADPAVILVVAQFLWKSGDVSGALPLFETLSSTGNPAAADYLVQALSRFDIDKGRKQQIFTNLQSAADSGQVAAAKALGNAYFYGTGVPLSLAKSQTYRAAAAERNDAEAQYLLGMMLLESSNDDGVDAGRHWLERSAAGGYPLARAALLTLPNG
jgi:TPR repeat protein